ncbi:hypothetical protein LTR53_014745, partial [Teratosphaeriaceae sp. CCFEE 6253]
MHGISASVSAAASGNGGTGPPSALAKHRQPSRSNSISSSSVVTVKRTGSLSSSSTGTRHSAMPVRPQSPGDKSLLTLRVGREHMPPDQKRRKSVAVEPPARPEETAGLNNLNRWSESTNSSAASLSGARRSRASSGAALQGLDNQQPSPQKRSRTGIEYSPRSSPNRNPLASRASSRQRRLSPDASPEQRRHRSPRPELFATSLTALPPLHTTPALTDPSNDTESPSTIQTVTTPSTHSSYLAQDYFGDDGVSPRNKARDKRPVVIRNHTAPMSAINHMRTPIPEVPREPLRRTQTSDRAQAAPPPDGSSRRGSRSREAREKDKKAMLSKALQKANTAVLLDNAQNFEGALEAYTDACRLLQQVMDRSSAAEDKRKLEAIKVTYSNRIEELEQLDASRPTTAEEKGLPARPMSDESVGFEPRAGGVSPVERTLRSSVAIGTATGARVVDVPKLAYPREDQDGIPPRASDAAHTTTLHDVRSRRQEARPERESEQGEILPLRSEESSKTARQTLLLPALENQRYMPAPLSPRKPPSPLPDPAGQQILTPVTQLGEPAPSSDPASNADANENAGSWLDTIDESSSCRSSVHVSSRERKHIRGNSAATDPDVDVAFDAAVEAAYDEGLEPDLDASRQPETLVKHAPKESVGVASPDIKEVL